MKNLLLVILCSLSVLPTFAQHTGIVPVHRALSGDTIYDGDTTHHSPLSFALWHLPDGRLQALGPGSVEHPLQDLMIEFLTDRLSGHVSMQTHLPEVYLLKARIGYTFPISQTVFFQGGLIGIFGEDPPHKPYPMMGSSTLLSGYLQGIYLYHNLFVSLQYELGWFRAKEIEILDPQKHYYEIHRQTGYLHFIGLGWETEHNTLWYHKLFIKGCVNQTQMLDMEAELMRGFIDKHLYVGLLCEYASNIHHHKHLAYGVGVKWKV